MEGAFKIVEVINNINDIYESFDGKALVQSFPIWPITYDVNAIALGANLSGHDDPFVIVEVSPVRKAALADFTHQYAFAAAELSIALGLVPGPQVLFAAFGVDMAIVMYATVESYGQAFDPPDANYTTIVDPRKSTNSISKTSRLGPLRDLLRSELEVSSLKAAEAISRNRADGAELASDWLWADRQLTAAADYAARAAEAESRTIWLQSLVFDSLSDPPGAITQSVLDDLEANGIPEPISSAMQRAGFGDDEIERMRQAIIAQDSDAGSHWFGSPGSRRRRYLCH